MVQQSLWADPLATPPGGIVDIGLTDHIPSFDAIKAGDADTNIQPRSPTIVGWGHIFGALEGDTIVT